jgi:PHP family Zn ribbon phosphoesterase
VKDRVKELSDRESGYNVDYLHLPPLAKIIQLTVGHSSPTTKTVQKRYKAFNQAFGAEIDILIEEEIEDLAKVDEEVAESIRKFREDEIIMVPGGGGSYGERFLPENEEEASMIREEKKDEIHCRYCE